jgi:glycosyltransferase involved in cell wall biosynthesis
MTEGGIRTIKAEKAIPRVTIITVTYDVALFLEDFLKNVLPYRSPEVELIILDGNSTDDTLSILQQYNNQIDYWRSEPDAGIYDAMNHATQYARGQWLYFIGADDRLLPGFNKAIKYLTNANTIYYGKVVFRGEVFDKKFKRYDFAKINICHQSIFYPASVFKHYQYNTTYKVFADHYLNMCCFTDKRYQWQFIDELMAVFDPRGYSSSTKDFAFEKDYYHNLRRQLGWWIYLRYRFREMKHRGKKCVQ